MEKQVDSTCLYQGAVFTMNKDHVMLEDGRIVQRDVIHHPGGAGILLWDHDQVLLISQYRYGVQAQLWEIPAGKLEIAEDPLSCVKRELNEEAGYESERILPLCSFFTTPGFCDERIYVYLGIGAKEVEQRKAMDDDEAITSKWFSLSQAYEMIQNKEIIDAKTIIAIQQAMLRKTSNNL